MAVYGFTKEITDKINETMYGNGRRLRSYGHRRNAGCESVRHSRHESAHSAREVATEEAFEKMFRGQNQTFRWTWKQCLRSTVCHGA